MMFIVAEKHGPHGLLLVVTDKDLLGKKFSAGKKQLDLTMQFYAGEAKRPEDVKKLLVQARDVHLTGKNAVALGVELELVDPNCILWVEGVPHAEAVG